ncbi:hypothetical protein [Streptomyces canus]|uniref:hypothetical protein n=1 Tax=Streptomyces canus TaxID=58343 RepID=UPI0027D89951|nr:hypothetical protein [Streptomyces canus]
MLRLPRPVTVLRRAPLHRRASGRGPALLPARHRLTGVESALVVLAVHLRLGILLQADAVTEPATAATVARPRGLVDLLVRRGSEPPAYRREIAEAAQRAVLPRAAGRIGRFALAVPCEAAQTDAFIRRPFARMVVGDVRGKGMGPVAAVASVIAVFREAVEEETTPTPTRGGTRRDSVEAFEELTTAVLAELPHGDGVVRIVSRVGNHRVRPPRAVLRPRALLAARRPS